MSEVINCCSCSKPDIDDLNYCYYCNENYCEDCSESCLNCNRSICKACFSKSQGAFMDRCNDCYLKEYGTGDEPDYPDPNLDDDGMPFNPKD